MAVRVTVPGVSSITAGSAKASDSMINTSNQSLERTRASAGVAQFQRYGAKIK